MRGWSIAAMWLATACGRLDFAERSSPDTKPCAYQLCDDFEAPTLASVWTPGGVGVTIDPTTAHGGRSSVHFQASASSPGLGAFSFIGQSATFAFGSAAIYVRAFMRFGAVPAANNYGPVLNVTESVNGFEDSLILHASSLNVYSQWPDNAAGDGAPPPTDTWLCVLWSVTRATTPTGTVAVAGDVAPALLAGVQTEGPPLDTMNVGIIQYPAKQLSPQPQIDLWVDDLLVSDAPLACSD